MTYATTTIQECLENLNNNWFLPSIQRPFVWDSGQIVRLFDSLLKGLPISSFLVWDLSKDTVTNWDTYSFISNFKQGDTHNQRVDISGQDATLVLDGQQRLTSMLIGFFGSYTIKAKHARATNPDAWSQKWLYLDLLKSPDEQNSDDLDTDISVTYGLDFFEREQRQTPENYWFRVSRLSNLTSESEFEALHADVIEKLPAGTTRTDRKIVEENLERLWQVYASDPIISYFSENGQSLDRVLNIFIRANEAGSKLTKSDLLMTMATSKWKSANAREEVFNFVDHLNKNLSRRNKVNKDFVLKACLVLTDLEVAYKVDNFTNTNLAIIEDAWPSIKKTLIRTFELVNAFGIDGDNLTSTNALMPIAYFLHKTGQDLRGSTDEEAKNRRVVHQFLLGSLLNAAFSGTSDRAISSCRGILRDHLRIEKSFPLLKLVQGLEGQRRTVSFSNENIRQILSIKYGDKRCFLALSLIYNLGAIDAQDVHIDHIIPTSKSTEDALIGKGFSGSDPREISAKAQQLGNLQFLLSRENLEKNDQPFSHWIETRDENFLDRHCLPKDRSLWKTRNLPEFISEREKLIVQKILQISPAIQN